MEDALAPLIPRSGRLRAWLGAAVYPAVMIAAVAAAHAALSKGADSGATVAGINVAAMVVVLALERALPYRERWNRSFGDVRTDVLHLIFSTSAGELGRTLGVAGAAWASVRLSAAIGAGLWPSGWPVAAQVGLAMVVGELPVYWLHRLEHRGGFLWRLHAVHHSAPRLYFLNSARNHPIDAALSVALLAAPLVLLGAGEKVLAISMVIWAVHALLQHSNVDVRLGPLNWILSMAEVHRWHHSRVLGESNANYGQTLLVWDVVFGTRRVPAGREPPEDVGLAGLPAFPMGWLGQLASPFVRALWRGEEAGGATSVLPPGKGPSSPAP
jgi:sterol desaturase/sphingolipid hydroxylase (fatty acid hydroxylase superfamily)